MCPHAGYTSALAAGAGRVHCRGCGQSSKLERFIGAGIGRPSVTDGQNWGVMEKLFEFAAAHWVLVGLTLAVIAGLVANEIYGVIAGRSAVDANTATRLYNNEDAVFIDVRDENAYHKRHLPGAINVPEKHIANRGDYLAGYAGRPAIVYADGNRALAKVLTQIEAAGLSPVYQLRGGIMAWQEANLPTEGRG